MHYFSVSHASYHLKINKQRNKQTNKQAFLIQFMEKNLSFEGFFLKTLVAFELARYYCPLV